MDDDAFDFAGLGVTAQLQFGKDQFAVDGHFKSSPTGGEQIPGANVGFYFTVSEHFFRQTDGASRVISRGAVFQGYIQ